MQGNPLLPDVLIYSEAVRWALEYDEFFNPNEAAKARTLLDHGEARASELAAGKHSWTAATGLVVRGYVSKIDGSVQPYGLVVPPDYSPVSPHRWRLDLWFHGRNETLSQLNFLADRERNQGEFTPPSAIVLHLYGRFCNASKFAGEVDLFEALDAVKHQYAIDENRILDRGFSMGGASAWHFGVHYAGLWAAVAPGAGFSETIEYLKLKPETLAVWQRKLLHLYDATDYAANLYNTATIAYNGEIDPQRQAADMMERAMAEEGLALARLVGPQTAHKYHPETKLELARRIDAIAARGREEYPRKLRFTTWTLAYNRIKWVTVDGLIEHWERARVDAEIAGASAVHIATANVSALTLDMGPGGCPLDPGHKVALAIDGQSLTVAGPASDRSWRVELRKAGARWTLAEGAAPAGLRKVHGLQGPIDDAFLDRFIFVSPTGAPIAPGTAAWVNSEEKRAITEWRRQFRGEPIVRTDAELTDAEIAASNLILWGDPGSNRVLARIAARLPIEWTASGVLAHGTRYAASAAPVLVYPNPLNPRKYVVLNSGFTFREADYASNAMQTPKLPDYAIIDTATPAGAKSPGKILLAGFFNEEWQW